MENHSHESRGIRRKSRKKLTLALVLTAFFMTAVFLGGYFTGSLTLIAVAGHLLANGSALVLTFLAISFAANPANARKNFAFQRAETLASLVKGLTLAAVAAGIIFEAVRRWNNPLEINVLPMLLVAFGGLGINLLSTGLLQDEQEEKLKERGAWQNIYGDAFGSIAAIIAAAAILFSGWTKADLTASLVTVAITIFSAQRLVKKSAAILLVGAPHINSDLVEETILRTQGVTGVHDLHIWTLDSGIDALSAHVRHEENVRQVEIWRELRTNLREQFGISHFTFQLETPDFEDEEIHLNADGSHNFPKPTAAEVSPEVEQLPLLIDFLPKIKPKTLEGRNKQMSEINELHLNDKRDVAETKTGESTMNVNDDNIPRVEETGDFTQHRRTEVTPIKNTDTASINSATTTSDLNVSNISTAHLNDQDKK